MPLIYRIVFINLLLKPKKAFGTIYAYGLYKYTWPLFMLLGISGRLTQSLYKLADSRTNLFLPLMGNIILGALLGWIGLWIFTILISVTGKWLDGRADSDELFDIVSYAAIGSVLTLLATVVSLYLLRHDGYTDGKYPHNWDNVFYCIVRVHYYIQNAGSLYFFLLMVIAVSVAQGFSLARGFANVILPGIVFIGVFLLVMSLVKFITYLF